ncbi:hypothetical protein K1W54_33425 [Micromonospora sp. CPCC 205371]|nr:hypothetical protein [Micromonospora sp. CPCC 205371]
MEVAKILAAFADLAPAGGERVLDVSGGGRPLVWLAEPDRAPRNTRVDRLAALDALRRDERVLRLGWTFVVGGAEVGGARRKVRLPLLAQPVRLEWALRGYRVVPAGDLELTPLIEDRAVAAGLEAAPGLASAGWLGATGTAAWVKAAAAAAGLAVREVLAEAPKRVDDTVLTGVAAPALFVTRDVVATGLRDTLLAWAAHPDLESTALGHVYGDRPHETSVVDSGDPLPPLPLTAAQPDVVRRPGVERVVVAGGPPGGGKSHAAVAAALDVVDRGGSVLVATQSVHAADVLADLVRRYDGPAPVLFGDSERRADLAADLSRGAEAGADAERVRAIAAAVEAAAAPVTSIRAGIAAALDTERRAARWPPRPAELARGQRATPALQADAPGPFTVDADHASASTLLAAVTATGGGWWRRWRRRRTEKRLRRMLGAAPAVPHERLRAALDAAVAARAAARLAVGGGTDLAPAWRALADGDAALAAAVGAAKRRRATSTARWNAAARRSATALGAALRAGRNRRREMLTALDGPALVRALPLWIGTVTDVDDLLPPTPGMFDLVVLDEAAHIDQLRAAPVLARAKRALVIGDPRQLRFVSFVADVEVAGTLRQHGLEHLADRLDVRRASAFDVATGAAAVTWLGEHYRCAPHLIGFSARRFYSDRLELVTRHPRNELTDLIELVRVPGASVDDGVNRAEVDAVLDQVRRLAEAPPEGGIGVITPFRAQADAIETALLGAFTVEEIQKLGLRSGTVHGFQGSEAGVVVASLGLVDGDSASRHRFAADPNLFNVMVTRARHHMTVVTSLASPQGLIGEYFQHAEQPGRSAPGDGQAPSEWAEALARELRRAGVPVRFGYPVGRWRIDLCAGEGDGAVGLICGVHPDGIDAHIERQRTLARAGWRLHDAFASRWAGDPVRAALELALSP